MRGGPELNFRKPPVPGLLSKDVIDILGDLETGSWLGVAEDELKVNPTTSI
jgi:hypothetical protein